MRRFSYVLIVCSCLFLLTAGYYFSYQLGSSDTSEIQPSQLRETEQILQPSYLVRIVDGKVVIQHPDGSVYEATEISEESLPMSVREKIQEEYRLNSRQELYSPAKKILELSPLVRYNDIDYCGCTSNPNMSVKQAGDKNE